MGMGELAVVAVICLLVFGPEKTMAITQQAFSITKKVKTLWEELSTPKESPHEHRDTDVTDRD